MGDLTTDTKEIEEIIQSYYKGLYSIKLENLEYMYTYLEKFHKLNLIQTRYTIKILSEI